MTPLASPRVLVIDDHVIFRMGLRMVIEADLPGATVFEAPSLADALGQAVSPHAILLDIRLDGTNGLDGIALLRQKWPATPVLMLSSHDEPETVRLALNSGATGFISKANAAHNVTEALRTLLAKEFIGSSDSELPCAQRGPTPRQTDVLVLLNEGLSNKLIARQLSLSENTVRRHVQDILELFGVVSRAEAVFCARSRGLID
jgi:DNA-binding NarL/FixJ family response regulator